MNSIDFNSRTDNEEINELSNDTNGLIRSKIKDSQSNSKIHSFPKKNNEESKFAREEEIQKNGNEKIIENKQQKEHLEKFKEEKKAMSKEEINLLIDKKKSELDIRIFDMVTKNQIEEKKIEDLYESQENDEEKSKLLKQLEELIKTNEDTINDLKE